MNTTLTKPKATKASKARGRKQTLNSVRMSRAMFIMVKVDGKELHEVADKYNNEARRIRSNEERIKQGKRPHTFTPQAVAARVKMYALQFPAEVAQILGQAPAVVQAAHIVREHSRTVKQRELVHA